MINLTILPCKLTCLTEHVLLTGIGYGQAIATWAVSTFYVSLMEICVFYFFASFSATLPWVVCGPWASSMCVDVASNSSAYLGNSTSGSQGGISAAEEYLV